MVMMAVVMGMDVITMALVVVVVVVVLASQCCL
jgi:hypothetical protein